MKRSVRFFLLALPFVLSSCLLWADQPLSSPKASDDNQPSPGLPNIKLSIKGKPIIAEVANTKAAREKGMMFRKTLGENDGMLFVFLDSIPLNFWMKNSSIPLSIAFIDEKGIVLNVLEMVPLTEDIYKSSGSAKFALEMNKGWFAKNGIKPGDPIPGVLEAPPDVENQDKSPFILDQVQLDWGKTQVQQMLKDRPVMAKYIREGDMVWNWTVRQFAGEYSKGGVKWDPADPPGAWDSISNYPNPEKNKLGSLQNTAKYAVKTFHAGESKTGPVLWYEMALEFCNLANKYRFDAIDADARGGRIGKADYAFEYMAVEDISTIRIAYDFFFNIWVPNCKKLFLPPVDKRFTERFGGPGGGWSQEDFQRAFNEIGKVKPESQTPDFLKFVAKDFAQHYDWYTARYDKYAPEVFTQKGLPIPDSKPSIEIEKHFLDGLVRAAPKQTAVSPEDRKAMDDIPPPP